ncbi:unnamed protein product [Rotaria magnacalcarata]|uniref:RNA-dependent RNA polymerase n=2 Tax=Rotaria magnacalcarata TaxID=392030 RepID=A0A818YJ14_9BILA|nr:unnamed protein product [Rotaria magnacalcarata]CAF3882951.1 unnamed protein product [Rotaria magnacalcarata]
MPTKLLDIYPAAYQIRMASCKGLVFVELRSILDQFYIKISPSMKKFGSSNCSLDICKTSEPIPTTLNNQIILLMSGFGVLNEAFVFVYNVNDLKTKNEHDSLHPYPEDMLVLEAVDSPELYCLTDVIVFSTKRERKFIGVKSCNYLKQVKPLNYQTIVPNVLLNSKLINYIDIIKYCYSLLGASSYGDIFNLHTNIVDKNLENCEQPTCQKVVIELANMFYAASEHTVHLRWVII